ncbi:helix-turn-helix domain-containing protein [Enterococcus sp. BWR-S5]|uniref:helix-turn-helix domain-containing protein n=1 Tax=Enterococcus sp. BWR-S5 TaxID=2787714 RepID=UPI001924B103|nr:helix-turn-helix domain-containing protein [Enterococcus sp. BWR-S5]MBL1223922.1 helix-turn-helix domain-containing protein [Enterococcus sp. BWR-S5]
MERLLSTKIARRILLLNWLYGAEDWITAERLATKLHCSVKTVFKDCDYIEANWKNYLTIDVSKRNGLKMSLSSNHSVHDIYADILKSSDAFTLLEAVFFHPNQGSEELEKKCFMSASTLYRLYRKINLPLKERNLRLERNPFFLYGEDEREIRYFFSYYFVEVYGVHRWPFKFKKEAILRLVKKLNKDFQLYLSDIRVIHLAFSIAVTLTRIEQGYTSPHEAETVAVLRTSVGAVTAEEYTNELLPFIDELGLTLPSDWYNDFSNTIFWWLPCRKNTDEKQIQQSMDFLIDEIQSSLHVTIDDQSLVKIKKGIQNIYCLHQIYPHKKHIIYSRFFYSGKSIKQNFILFSAFTSKALARLEKESGFPWKTMYLNEILHCLMLYWQGLPAQLFKKRSKVSITVLSDLGREHAEVMSSIIKMVFTNNVIVTTQNTSLLNTPKKELVEKSDLYVSNHRIQYLAGERVVVVEDILSQRNIIELRKIIEQNQLRAFKREKREAMISK